MKECRGEIIYKDDYITIINCKQCGFVHIHPYPDHQKLSNHYKDKFYEDDKPEYISKFEKEKDYWFLIYNERLKVAEKYVQTGNRRFLDIGSSIGYFLKAAQARGWEAVGVEPSRTAAEYANSIGAETINDVIENIPLEKIGKFSFINLSLVLEHIAYPSNLIERAYNLLIDGGIICIDVPNDFNILQKILVEKFNKRKYWITSSENPHHLNYFSMDSLKNLMIRNNFNIVYETATFPMEFFVLMGDDYIENDSIGKECHKKRMQFETNMLNANSEILENMYQSLYNKGIGRELIIFGRK